VPKKEEAITITENPRSVLNKVSSVQYDSIMMENLKIVHISPSIHSNASKNIIRTLLLPWFGLDFVLVVLVLVVAQQMIELSFPFSFLDLILVS